MVSIISGGGRKVNQSMIFSYFSELFLMLFIYNRHGSVYNET